MSTRLYQFVLSENGGDETCLQVRVWAGTPWIIDAWVGEMQDGAIRERERDMLLWCSDQFGEEAFPFGPTPRSGRWRRGGATVFGWTWFGFSTEAEMNLFLAAWPTPPSRGRPRPARRGQQERGRVMAKKPVRTFHPLAVAKSLEAQNQAVGLLFMAAHTAHDLAGSIDDVAALRRLIGDVYAKAKDTRAAFWPDDEAGE